MNRRSFLKNAAVTATAAIPFTAFVERTIAVQDHKRGLRRAETAGYGRSFPRWIERRACRCNCCPKSSAI